MNWPLLLFCSLALPAYAYLCYPLLISMLAKFGPRVREGEWTPSLSVVIAARNEVNHIARKLRSLLACDYPRDRFEIIVVSDASTDGTDAAVREFSNAGVRLIPLPQRSGKVSAMNAGAASAGGEVLVFMDARQELDPQALRALVSNFSDPRVGLCTGELSLISEGGTAQALSLYWRYERWLRRCESRLHSTLGASGALMAVRRQLFTPLDPETILDDVVLPLRVIASGYRAIHEPEARVYDNASLFWSEEAKRKVRTLAGNFQLIFHPQRMANPFTPRIAFQFISHKLLRLLVPFALLCILIASIATRHPAARGFAVAQGLFYALALAGFALERTGRRAHLLSIPFVFTSMQIAVVQGLVRYLTAKEKGRW